MATWTIYCYNRQRTADDRLKIDTIYGVDFDTIPSRVAEAWESGKYYSVQVDGPHSRFDLTNSKNLCCSGDVCYLFSVDLNEGHFTKHGNKWAVAYRGEDRPHGEYNTLEEAIRSFNRYWEGAK